MSNETESRPGCEIVLKRFDIMRRPLGERLYPAIGKVLYIADYLMPRRRALGKESVANALNFAADDKPACHSRD